MASVAQAVYLPPPHMPAWASSSKPTFNRATRRAMAEPMTMPRILIVDDSDAQLEFMAAVLRAGGHDVALASDGLEALKRFEQFRPDLVITDIYMPECDGVELVLQLRRRKSSVPVIAISGGCAREQTVLLSMMPQLGANLALAKPLSAGVLMTAVKSLLALPSITEERIGHVHD
jgi:CheY-like chemotaxis protein